MKIVIALVGLFTVIAGVGSMAVPGMCPFALLLGVVFFLLAARQSRKDREAREDRLWQQRNS